MDNNVAKIIITNKFSKIENENDVEFLLKLNKHLSFKYVGVEFVPAYKNHMWDGREYLLSKNLSFMTGLLDNVIDFYKLNNKEIELIDNRIKFISNKEIDIRKNLLEKHKIIPYDYQDSAVEKAILNDRMIFKHPTGSGKSITAALITSKFNKPTIVYVISKELLFQFHKDFSSYFDQEIGIVGAGYCNVKDITIISIWTLGKMLGIKKKDIILDDEQAEEDDNFSEQNRKQVLNHLKKCKIHLLDECHISSSATVRKIYKAMEEPEKIFGFSGTPIREDGADLLIQGIFGKIIDKVSASELIKRKILAQPFIKFVYSKGEANFTDTYLSVYSNNVINNIQRNGLILQETKKLLDKNYQVLVLFKTLKHGAILYELFQKYGIECEILNGKDTEEKRENVKNLLLDRKLNCLLASQIYDIGINIPTLNALVLSGSGKSVVKCMQRVGRVIRNGKEKPYAAIVDFWDDVKFLKKHSKIRKEIYEMEPEFEIKLPPQLNAKKK